MKEGKPIIGAVYTCVKFERDPAGRPTGEYHTETAVATKDGQWFTFVNGQPTWRKNFYYYDYFAEVEKPETPRPYGDRYL